MFETTWSEIKSLNRHRSPSWRVSRWWNRDWYSASQTSLVRLLAVAHREQLELAPLIEQFSKEHRGVRKLRLRNFHQRLAASGSLPDALEQSPELLPDEDVLAIRFGTQTGTLSSTFEELLERRTSGRAVHAVNRHNAFLYAGGMALAIVLALVFMMLFIAPMFRDMFEEFGLNLPPALGALEWLCRTLWVSLPLLIASLLMVAVLIWLMKPIRLLRRALASRLFEPTRQLRNVQLLRLLSTAVEAGRPVSGALSTLARYHFDSNIRVKLLDARNEIELGAETWRSLADRKLLNAAEFQAIVSEESAASRAWLMRRLADRKEAIVMHRRAMVSTLFHPAVVLVAGAIVLWIFVAFFGVLVTMIVSLS